jgi:signal transduction histidine kinase
MRTPLNTAFMTIDVMKAELLQQHIQEGTIRLLADVKRSCRSAIDVLDELLDFERLEAGVMLLDRVMMTAFDLVKEAVRCVELQVME